MSEATETCSPPSEPTAKRVVWLTQLTEIADPGSRGFDPNASGQDTVLLVRQGDAVFAYRDLCPHFGDTPMAWRKDAYLNRDGSRIVCSAHGAQFDIATGRCLRGPCMGQNLSALQVEVDAHGRIGVHWPP